MSALFISDVHLENADDLKTRSVIRFFQEVVGRYQQLYILGDLFDVWPGTGAYLIRRFDPVIAAMGRLIATGCEIHYLEGNHDFCLGEFFSKKLGICVYPREMDVTLGGRRTIMVHGDLENPDERGNRHLRRVFRSRPVQWLRSSAPDSWIFELGRKASNLSRSYQKEMLSEQRERVRAIYRRAALRYFDRGFDMVLMGHTHIPDDYYTTHSGRACRYVNLGTWVKNYSYLEFDGYDFYTKTHPDTNV